jgi:23S rRNA (guanine745-N1)-methyltransferase
VLAAVVDCLACPYCGLGLSEVEGALGCAAGHSFDLARQGYVTLLPAGARPAGDDAAMVAARADFLAAGHYAPLTAALLAAMTAGPGAMLDAGSAPGAGVAGHMPDAGSGPVAGHAPDAAGGGVGPVLDVGAGTGDHLAAVVAAGPGLVGIALDSSRYAARRAARVHPRVGAVVADAWAGLPVRTGSVGTVLDVFSPRNGAETARVLRPGGRLVVVTPGPDHLAGLVDAVGGLTVDPAKEARLADALTPHLTPVDRTEHRWPLELSPADAVRALAMGPSARHLTDLPARVATLPAPVGSTASIVVTTYPRP